MFFLGRGGVRGKCQFLYKWPRGEKGGGTGYIISEVQKQICSLPYSFPYHVSPILRKHSFYSCVGWILNSIDRNKRRGKKLRLKCIKEKPPPPSSRFSLFLPLCLSSERDKKVNLFALIFSLPNQSLKGDSSISGLYAAKRRYVRSTPHIGRFMCTFRLTTESNDKEYKGCYCCYCGLSF